MIIVSIAAVVGIVMLQWYVIFQYRLATIGKVLFGTLSLLAQFAYWSRIVSGLNQEHA